MARIGTQIDQWRKQLDPLAIPRHFRRWPALRGLVWPNPYNVDPSSFAGAGASVAQQFTHEVQWLKGWVDRRVRWLDANLTGSCPGSG